MKNTNAFQKFSSSLINAIIVFIVALPFLLLTDNLLVKRLVVIIIFFVYSLIFMFLNKNRDLGMILTKSYWREKYSIKNQLLFNFLYTLSFATLFFHVYFPLDLFLINMILVQLPFVLIMGTTFHGYFSGKMVTVKK